MDNFNIELIDDEMLRKAREEQLAEVRRILEEKDWALCEEAVLKYQISSAYCKKTQKKILICAFSGKYGYGSCGNDDAYFMHVILRIIKSWSGYSGIILDLQLLAYEWGNSLYGCFYLALAVVVSVENQEAIGNLLKCEGNDTVPVFRDIEPALLGVVNS